MPTHYSRLSSHNVQNADELDAAFESDGDDEASPGHTDSATPPAQAAHTRNPPTVPGEYNFEADFEYAVPPPGSPPGPSALARPNQYGNSNGLLPAAPVVPQAKHRGFFRRTIGALLPTYYQRIATDDGVPIVGSGTNNDGVFANLTAKPGRGRVVQDGESIHVVPEDVQKEAPPSYAVAQADAVPAYYETIVHTPATGLDGEVLVDSMPTGSVFTFAWTMLISLSFQFIGFLLTYLLHTSHASKHGSRAGLGITIIQYAFFLRRRASLAVSNDQFDNYQPWSDPSAPSESAESAPFVSNVNNTTLDPAPTADSNYPAAIVASATTEWLAFFLMTVGWFVLLTSLLGFWRVKRWERGIRQANEPVPVPTAEEIEQDRNLRMNLMHVFGIPMDHDGNVQDAPSPMQNSSRTEEGARLERDLRASGLL